MGTTASPSTTLATGFPLFTAKRMISKLLEADDGERVYLLASHERASEATEFISAMAPAWQRRVVR